MIEGHARDWIRLVAAANAGEWARMRTLLTPDAVQHEPTSGLGVTAVRFRGADEIVEGHRRAAEDLGARWEIAALAEAEDLVTGVVLVDLRGRRRVVAAMVVSFIDEGLVSEIYTRVNRSARLH
jgi:SnoaL-like domain